MWRAECRECDVTAPRLTRDGAATALKEHIHATGHQAWLMLPMPDRNEPSEFDEACPAWRHRWPEN
jgi:hypothetical protein